MSMADDVKFTLTTMTDDDIVRQAGGKQVQNAENYFLRGEPKPYAGGLFDPAIFGKMKSCTCGFKRAKSKTDPPSVCPHCKTLVFSNEDDYMRNSAFFKLSIPVIFPYKITKLWDILKRMGIAPIKHEGDSTGQWYDKLRLLWNTEYHIQKVSGDGEYRLKDSSGKKYDLIVGEVNETTEYSEIGLVGLYNLQKYTLDNSPIDFSQYLNTCLPITSSYFRYSPLKKRNGAYSVSLDDQTILYAAIIEMNKLMGSVLSNFVASPIDTATVMHNINMMVVKQMNSVELLRGGKYHTIRENMRQRVKRSGRANIYPALDLDMDHVYIPRSLAYTALNQDIIDRLAEVMGYEDARRAYEQVTPEATKAFEEINDESMVLLLRNPTLHKMNLMAFHPILSDEPAIGIPIEVCPSYNAD